MILNLTQLLNSLLSSLNCLTCLNLSQDNLYQLCMIMLVDSKKLWGLVKVLMIKKLTRKLRVWAMSKTSSKTTKMWSNHKSNFLAEWSSKLRSSNQIKSKQSNHEILRLWMKIRSSEQEDSSKSKAVTFKERTNNWSWPERLCKQPWERCSKNVKSGWDVQVRLVKKFSEWRDKSSNYLQWCSNNSITYDMQFVIFD